MLREKSTFQDIGEFAIFANVFIYRRVSDISGVLVGKLGTICIRTDDVLILLQLILQVDVIQTNVIVLREVLREIEFVAFLTFRRRGELQFSRNVILGAIRQNRFLIFHAHEIIVRTAIKGVSEILCKESPGISHSKVSCFAFITSVDEIGVIFGI